MLTCCFDFWCLLVVCRRVRRLVCACDVGFVCCHPPTPRASLLCARERAVPTSMLGQKLGASVCLRPQGARARTRCNAHTIASLSLSTVAHAKAPGRAHDDAPARDAPMRRPSPWRTHDGAVVAALCARRARPASQVPRGGARDASRAAGRAGRAGGVQALRRRRCVWREKAIATRARAPAATRAQPQRRPQQRPPLFTGTVLDRAPLKDVPKNGKRYHIHTFGCQVRLGLECVLRAGIG